LNTCENTERINRVTGSRKKGGLGLLSTREQRTRKKGGHPFASGGGKEGEEGCQAGHMSKQLKEKKDHTHNRSVQETPGIIHDALWKRGMTSRRQAKKKG